MKSKRLVSAAIIFLLMCIPVILVLAQRYSVEQVPNVQLEDAQLYVTDPHKILSDDDFFELNDLLIELRDSLKIEAAVVVLPSIETNEYGSAKEFANKLFNSWGIGDRSINNGLLILLLTNEGEREIVFETGTGTEQILTDGMSKLIQTKRMIPLLKEGEFGQGLIAGVQEIIRVIKGTSGLEEATEKKGSRWPWILYFIVGFIAIIGIESNRRSKAVNSDSPYKAAANFDNLKGAGCIAAVIFLPQFIIYAIYKSVAKKGGQPAINCEKCHSKETVRIKGKPEVKQEAIPGQDGMKEYVFECSKCGFVHTELVPFAYVKPRTQSSGSSGGSSSSGRSSRRGGSWGGGSSGGGGASTKF